MTYEGVRSEAQQRTPGVLLAEDASESVLVRAKNPDPQAVYSSHRLLRGQDINYPIASINLLCEAPRSELLQIFSDLKAKKQVQIWGYEVISIKPAIPFDDSTFLPIHCTVKPGDKGDDLPGAILRCEGNATVLIPIDPLGNGKNSKEAVTTCTKGWYVQESIHYVGIGDEAAKEELQEAGYHQLVDSEADPRDVKYLDLKPGEFIVMGRHELLNAFSQDSQGCEIGSVFHLY